MTCWGSYAGLRMTCALKGILYFARALLLLIDDLFCAQKFSVSLIRVQSIFRTVIDGEKPTDYAIIFNFCRFRSPIQSALYYVSILWCNLLRFMSSIYLYVEYFSVTCILWSLYVFVIWIFLILSESNFFLNE